MPRWRSSRERVTGSSEYSIGMRSSEYSIGMPIPISETEQRVLDRDADPISETRNWHIFATFALRAGISTFELSR